MKELNLLLIIARQKDHQAYDKYFARRKLAAYASLPCHGTAQNMMLDLLGIEQTEKVMLTAVIGKQQTKEVLATLPDQMEIDLPGRGIDGKRCVQPFRIEHAVPRDVLRNAVGAGGSGENVLQLGQLRLGHFQFLHGGIEINAFCCL